jgi:vitamin B12/bleomycin/antimicrobial peptide transport system ATP-binding/permease protein
MIPAIAAEKDAKSANQSSNAQDSHSTSLSQMRPFLEIAIPFFREDRAAFHSLMGIVLLTLTKAALLIFFSYVRRDMFSALNRKDRVEFYKMIVKFFGALVVFVPIAVLYQYLRQRLALHWRKKLTLRVLDKYYGDRTFYIIECCKDIDNPDQRISEDLREFTSTSLDFFFILFRALINLLSFSVVLYHICPSLFLAIILYAVIGTYVTTKLGRSLVGQYYNKLLTEADFRFGLIRTRENAEGIAFYDSQATMEQLNITNLFEQVYSEFSEVKRQSD